MTRKPSIDFRKIDPEWTYLDLDKAYEEPSSLKDKFLYWHSGFSSGGPLVFWLGVFLLATVLLKPSMYLEDGLGNLTIYAAIGGALVAYALSTRRKREEIPIARIYVDGVDMGYRILYPFTKQYIEERFRGKKVKFDPYRYIFDYRRD